MARGFLSAGFFAGAVLCAAPVFSSAADTAAQVASAPLAIIWSPPGAPPAVDVTGLPPAVLARLAREPRAADEWAALFAVFVVPAQAGQAVPPMAGTWRVVDGWLRFEPRFPWARGAKYRAEFRPAQLPGGAGGLAPVAQAFELPAENRAPSAVVEEIFPTSPVLPENQLKFYVQFSAPMSRGSIYEHIHLRDAAGKDADLPFLDIDEELWNPAMTRLTLLIDPGRIKRGVKPLEDLGPVFEEGKSYTLAIDPTWHDAAGRPLRSGFQKHFRIGPADRTPPDPLRWTVRAPAAGTRDALVVTFEEPLDRALAQRLIAVASADGAGVAGETTLGDRETRWTFVPAQPWRDGAHALVVGGTIEDLAGNNPGKVFDVDVFERVDRKITVETVRVPFAVR